MTWDEISAPIAPPQYYDHHPFPCGEALTGIQKVETAAEKALQSPKSLCSFLFDLVFSAI